MTEGMGAGVSLGFSCEGPDLRATLGRLLSVLQAGFEPELSSWAEEDLLPSILQGWGEGWAPLAVSTLAEKRRLGYPDTPLVREGALQAAATQRGAPGNLFEVGPFSLSVGVDPDVISSQTNSRQFGGMTPSRKAEEIIPRWR